MNTSRPSFLLTLDTEGDDLWSAPKQVTTRNAAYLPRFQALCERFELLPTYLTNYEMAICPVFQEFARDGLQRGALEIGMHLHAWNSPPLIPLTADDDHHMPYLIQYPDAVMQDKIAFMTDLLESTFQVKMTSHRAGRWSFDARYARLLVKHGYTVDCSVTPHVSWRETPGDPNQRGGTDFSRAPELPYYLHEDDVCRPGGLPLLEVPVTIRRGASMLAPLISRHLSPRNRLRSFIDRRITPIEPTWLRPNRSNLNQMLAIAETVAAEKRPCLEWMLHSSELMPGGSPTFRTPADIDRLFADLETFFAAVTPNYAGATLSQFAEAWRQTHAPSPALLASCLPSNQIEIE